MFKEKKVELIELFYDLIYVYAISNLTKLLQTETTDIFGDFGRYFILCLVILQAWLYLTNYVNRYGEWNKSEYLLTTVNMLATIYMANTISDDWEIVSKSFNLAMLVMLGVCACNVSASVLQKEERSFCSPQFSQDPFTALCSLFRRLPIILFPHPSIRTAGRYRSCINRHLFTLFIQQKVLLRDHSFPAPCRTS